MSSAPPAGAAGYLLEVDGLVAGYAQPVVGPVSFRVGRGEVVGLWGANGTGKSTLINAIGHGARVFAGSIRQAPGLGVTYQEQVPVRLDGMPLTGRELLRYARADRQAPPASLAPLLGRRLDRLSGGQFQLLCVWSALATGADLVLLDEPTNNLDPPSEHLLQEILAAEQGLRAVLVVSHERDFLHACCSQVVEIA